MAAGIAASADWRRDEDQGEGGHHEDRDRSCTAHRAHPSGLVDFADLGRPTAQLAPALVTRQAAGRCGPVANPRMRRRLRMAEGALWLGDEEDLARPRIDEEETLAREVDDPGRDPSPASGTRHRRTGLRLWAGQEPEDRR